MTIWPVSVQFAPFKFINRFWLSEFYESDSSPVLRGKNWKLHKFSTNAIHRGKVSTSYLGVSRKRTLSKFPLKYALCECQGKWFRDGKRYAHISATCTFSNEKRLHIATYIWNDSS